MQQKEKMRVYALARELDIDSKDLLQHCKEMGYDVKNQLSSLDPDQVDKLKERTTRASKGSSTNSPAAAVVSRPAVTNQSLDAMNRVRNLPAARTTQPSNPAPAPTEVAAPPTPAPASMPQPVADLAPPVADLAPPTPEPILVPETPTIAATATPDAPPTTEPAAASMDLPVAQQPMAPAPFGAPPRPTLPTDIGRMRDIRSVARPRPPIPGSPAASATSPAPSGTPTTPGNPPPGSGGGPGPGGMRRSSRPGVRPLGGSSAALAKPVPPTSLREKLMGRLSDANKPKENVIAPMKRLDDDQMRQVSQAQNKSQVDRIVAQVPAAAPTGVPATTEEDDDKKGRRPGTPAADAGGIPGRGDRHAKRKERADQRKASMAVTITGGQVQVNDDDERVRRRKIHARTKLRQGTQPRTGKVPIDEPITVRALSEAIGWKVGKLLFQLMELGAPKNTSINSVIDTELAETIALEANVELDIRRAQDAEDRLMASHAQTDEPEALSYRAPVVTIMGHVDHGKTTLLDYIRRSNVVDTEAGGITQVIRAWRVEHNGKPVTFIDTPGHEAFTKMRARGAQVTDIAVIVVAATDGVMPQTEEAINHARASDVQLVVCITKTDMPNANVSRTRQQLYGMNVLPDNMGGDTPFVETALVKDRDGVNWKVARGVDELLETLAVAAELRELKANPNKAASGVCLEAHKEGDEGIFATMLVQQGTLRKGEVVICGGSHGRVRAIYDDLGRPISEAGPSVPVRITGLDEVPDAGDGFHVVPELGAAREIAEKRGAKRIEAGMYKPQALTLESLALKKVTELKVIVKADFRGSIEAIRAELEKLKHDEVRVRILHAAIGAITESDVQLALTSPEDTLIVGFNVVPDDKAKTLADARGIQVREYNIIYNLKDDIKKALEGKLKPREDIIHLGRAVARETFKISRVGTIAGCFVTQGTIERSAKIRVIREGVVIYPAPEKTASLESLKRFKEDSREVREGLECGIKIAGYDDIKVGDVIEAYRIEQVLRTL